MLRNKKKSVQHFLNESIPFEKFSLLSEEGKIISTVSKEEGLRQAQEAELDIFCISLPQGDNLPVCRIGKYKKYLYQLEKKSPETNKKKSILKEDEITYHISENDFQTKMRRIKNWLKDGCTVKINLAMTKREMAYKDQAFQKCQEIISSLQKESGKIQVKRDIQLIGKKYNFLLYSKK